MSKNREKLLATTLTLSLCVGLIGPAVQAAGAGADAQPPVPIWEDRENYSFEERAAAMVAEMSLEEKASQMISGYAPAIPRLGLDWYGWWNEALHGVSRLQEQKSGNATTIYNTTSYPINLSMGSTWDPDLMYKVAEQIGQESREVVRDNSKELTFWSPTVNLNRDPRWGRSDESFGEDPYLTGQMAAQFVNGMEGKDENGELLDENGYKQSVTTIKHYLANNSEHNRLNGTSQLTEKELREYYSMVYRNIIENSNVSSAMTSYNRLTIGDREDIPASLDAYTMDTLLRQTFGFDGYVTSDCDSVWIAYTGNGSSQPDNATSGNGHGWIKPDGEKITDLETIAWAITAGEDLECNAGYSGLWQGFDYQQMIPAAVEAEITTPTGIFDENSVDVSLLRLLTARMELGEFDDDEGVVSWYNEARDRVESEYGADWEYVSSPTNGATTITEDRLDLAQEAAEASYVLLQNNPVENEDGTSAKVLPLQVPDGGAYHVVVVGHFARPNEDNNNMFLGGYSCQVGESAYDKMVNPYNGIKSAIEAINPDATVTFYKGFTDSGTQASQLNTIDPAAVEADAQADVVIAYAGTDSGTANEQGDRSTLELPGAQTELLKQLVAANPKTIVVMETISPNEVHEFDGAAAMLWSCYTGMQKGDALANVLLGNYNPAGHTSTIWVEDTDELADIRSYRLSPGEDATYGETQGRTYMYYTGDLRYPFGYGLSYTEFSYSNAAISATEATGDDTVTVTVDVTNNGAMDGQDVVQLYVASPNAGQNGYPIKRLVAFDKVNVPAGETVTATMTVDLADLAFWQEDDARFEVEPGTYTFQVSTSSADADIQDSLNVEITADATPVPSVLSAKPVQDGDKEADIPQRVIFDAGKTVDPQLTLAMSDDTLYGYVMKGYDAPAIPESMSVSYTSNRPEVVSVQDGVITTVGAGVATVTATLTDGAGHEATTDFVVYVKSDIQPTTITVDGTPIDGFSADVKEYTVQIPFTAEAPEVAVEGIENAENYIIQQPEIQDGAITDATITIVDGSISTTYTIHFTMEAQEVYLTQIQIGGVMLPGFDPNVTEYNYSANMGTNPGDYVVTAAALPGWDVSITQPTRIPGTATITVTSDEGGIRIYTINIVTQAESVNFANSTMEEIESAWSIENDTGNYELVPGSGLRLETAAGDMYEGTNAQQDLFTTTAPGDWDAVAKIYYPRAPYANYQQVAFVAYDDADNYAKVDVEYNGGLRAQSGLEQNGTFTSNSLSAGPQAAADGSLTVYLRIVKTGSSYSYAWSQDGVTFHSLGSNENTNLSDVKLGVYATSNSDVAAMDGYVEYIHIVSADAEEGHEGMDQWALDNVLNAVSEQIKANPNVTFLSGTNTTYVTDVPVAYDVTFQSDHPEILAEDGLVTAPQDQTDVTFTFTVSDGANTVTSEELTVTVSGQAFRIEDVVFNAGSMAEVDGDLRATVTVSNTTPQAQTGLMIVALYDSTGEMVNYCSLGKTIESEEEETFEAGFRVPFEKGDAQGYVAKVFVWDGASMSETNQIPLSSVVELK